MKRSLPPSPSFSIVAPALFAGLVWIACAEFGRGADHGREIFGVSAIDVFSEGARLHLLTAELVSKEEPGALFHRISEDGGTTWGEPSRVDEGSPPPFSPRRGMDPQVAASGDRVLAAWTTAGTDRWGSGPIATAVSDDGGATWTPGVNPADDGLTTGHGFLDLAADADGAFHLVWLDGRDGRQGLRYSRSDDGGATWAANRTIKGVTCECCRNTLALGADGTIGVLFRDHDPRDMKFSLSRNGGNQWSDPVTAGAFDWRFEGCPHVGGGIGITEGQSGCLVHALVWTGEEKSAGVHYIRIAENAVDEEPPREVRMGGSSATQPDLAAMKDGQVAAAWTEFEGGGNVLRYSLSTDHGSTWTEPMEVGTAGPTASHPLVAATDDGFRVFWTETPEDGSSRWRLQTLVALR